MSTITLDFGLPLQEALQEFKLAGLDSRERFSFRIEWSRRLTRAIGNCRTLKARKSYLIKLSAPIMARIQGARDREEAIKETLIHELAHAWCDHLYGKTKAHGYQFVQILDRLGRQELASAKRKDLKSVQQHENVTNIQPGDLVQFKYEGSLLVGRVLACGSKRATVYLPGLQIKLPYCDLARTVMGKVPWPWETLKVGEKVYVPLKQGYQAGTILSLGPTRAKVRIGSKVWNVPYGVL